MDSKQNSQHSNGKRQSACSSSTITLADVNRVLEAGQLLAAVLTPEELSALHALLDNPEHQRSRGLGSLNR